MRKAYLLIRYYKYKCPKCEKFLSSPAFPLLAKACNMKRVALEVVDLTDDYRAPLFLKAFPLGAKKLPALVYKGRVLDNLEQRDSYHIISFMFGDVSFLLDEKKKK